MALLTREVHGGRRGVVVFAQRNLEEFGRVSSSQSRAIRVKDNIIRGGFQVHTDMHNTYDEWLRYKIHLQLADFFLARLHIVKDVVKLSIHPYRHPSIHPSRHPSIRRPVYPSMNGKQGRKNTERENWTSSI
jgi:hypothetical protein